MGKGKNTAWGSGHSKECLSTPTSHRSEASDTADAVQDLMDDMDLLEEGMSQIGPSPKTPFRFM